MSSVCERFTGRDSLPRAATLASSYSRPTLGKLRRHSTPPLYVGPRGQRLYSDKTHLQQRPKFGESHEGPREKLDSIHFVDALEWIIE